MPYAGGVACRRPLSAHRRRVIITNRSIERANWRMKSVAGMLPEARHNQICDLLVNCTAVGMHPTSMKAPSTGFFAQPGVRHHLHTGIDGLNQGCSDAAAIITGGDMFVRRRRNSSSLSLGRADRQNARRAFLSFTSLACEV